MRVLTRPDSPLSNVSHASRNAVMCRYLRFYVIARVSRGTSSTDFGDFSSFSSLIMCINMGSVAADPKFLLICPTGSTKRPVYLL